ncbi:MAG TPA: aminoacyl-tRNA hydrolase [Buchnera sp. (in: enterobacteria)]|nr:aminoacyl-tRNA hydrolase [Buchnera sp. (in: enterobacteria)]
MIVGLGNPIKQYNNSRHNIGSWYIQELVKVHNKNLKIEKKFFGYISKIYINNKMLLLLIPNIFMNISGKSVFCMSSFYNIHIDEILIVHDELDLLPGEIKYKYGTGHNGHNGLRNIKYVFGKNIFFSKISIGIGRPIIKKDISSFVLSPPTATENILIKKSIKKIVFMTDQIIQSIFKKKLLNKSFYIDLIN